MEDSGGEISEHSSDDRLSRASKVSRVDETELFSYCFLEDDNVGYRLMEVFSVQFVDYEQVNLAETYSIILLNGGGGIPYALFERFPGDPSPVDSNLLTRRLLTALGPIELNFAVFTESATATLEVKLLDWKDEGIYDRRNTGHSEIEVFGLMTAWNKMITDERAKICMFRRDKETCALVRPGEVIPFSRCYTVCPVRSSIILDMSLYRPSDNDSRGDDLIVNRQVEVPAIQRDEELILESDCARIQLKVTFTY